jgi:hypothetical protein
MAKIIVEECQPRIAHVPEWGRLKIALPTEIVAVRRGAEIADREKLVIAPLKFKM